MNLNALVAVCFLLFLPSSLIAAGPQQTSESYYYSDGGRIELKPSADWVAVRYANPNQQTQPAAGLQAIDFTARRDLTNNRVSLLPIREKLTANQRAPLFAGLAAMPEIELVAPVFSSHGALMIVTDEFIASFIEGLPVSEIDSINQNHGVETVRLLRPNTNTWVLRVKGSDALATANTYHGLAKSGLRPPRFHTCNATTPCGYPGGRPTCDFRT